MFGASTPPRFVAKRVADATDFVAAMAGRTRTANQPVSFDRILHAEREPQNWLTYSGALSGQRYSLLTQLTPGNVKNLELSWIWQAQSGQKFEATPIVADGILYTVQAPNDVVALNAETGGILWTHPYTPKNYQVCCGRVNRGLAILNGTLFMGTLDAHLLAIDASNGKLVWDTVVANSADPSCERDICYSITHAPLVVKDKVIVGTAGGDGKIRGFIAAFNVATGKEVWRFSTIPGPGEPGHETWPGDSWKTGGASVWNTGSYDPDLNLTYWGTGNPAPDSRPETRLGDNLYSDSVVALDADTGKLKWYYQFTPNDDLDRDAAQVPILADIEWQSRPRKVLLSANKNGLMYVLDRATGQFLMGKPFVEVNWMSGFDDKGRPLLTPRNENTVETFMGTNWYPPSYSPSVGLFYVSAWTRSVVFGHEPRRNSPSYGAVRAFDPQTGEMKWEFRRNDAVFTTGELTTASGLLFSGVSGDTFSEPAASRIANGYFYALNARTGQLLWQMALTGALQSGPMTYAAGGKQYIAVVAGNTLFTLALRQ